MDKKKETNNSSSSSTEKRIHVEKLIFHFHAQQANEKSGYSSIIIRRTQDWSSDSKISV
jgi:hypothetical protein